MQGGGARVGLGSAPAVTGSGMWEARRCVGLARRGSEGDRDVPLGGVPGYRAEPGGALLS